MKAFRVSLLSFALMVLTLMSGGSVAADPSGSAGSSAAVSQSFFYVRGDAGFARLEGDYRQPDLEAAGGGFVGESFDSTPYLGAGLGWQLSNRFRVDLTGEYRFTSDIEAVDAVSRRLRFPNGVQRVSTIYEGELSSIVGLANAYLDLGTWNGVTPYVGAGVGFARSKLSDLFTTSNGAFVGSATGATVRQTSHGYSTDETKTSVAWALMAGASFDLTPTVKLDLGYRYLDLGQSIAASSGLLNCLCGVVGAPLEVAELDSHEFRIGIRWQLDRPAADYAPLK